MQVLDGIGRVAVAVQRLASCLGMFQYKPSLISGSRGSTAHQRHASYTKGRHPIFQKLLHFFGLLGYNRAGPSKRLGEGREES